LGLQDLGYTKDVVFETWTPGKKEIFYAANGVKGNIDGNHAMVGNLLKRKGVARHNLSEVVILELTKNTAKTKTVYTFNLFPGIGADSMIISGAFNDTWVKTEKGWLVKERIIVYDNLPAALLKK